ncbi:MAG: leucine-rich repeat domain-containing protein [Promethearchaeota archaeon]
MSDQHPSAQKEFIIKDKRGKEVLTVKLIDGVSHIFINDEELMICRFVPLAIPKKELPKFKDIESINDIIDHLDHSIEYYGSEAWEELSVEEREELDFFVNCSNLQAWVEHDYNTRLLDYRLSFPILKKLAKKGDEYARMRFKEELIERYKHGSEEVQDFILESYDLREELGEEFYGMYEPNTAEITKVVDKNKRYYARYEDFDITSLGLQMESRDELALLPTVSRLPKLTALTLKLPPHSIKDVECLKNLQTLEFLEIKLCNAKPLLEIATSLTNLKRLKIYTHEQFHFPKEAGSLANLTELRIGGDFKEFPRNISKMRSLKELELQGSKYEAISKEIGHLTNLEELVIEYFNPKEGTTGIPDSIANLTKVKEIYIMRCRSLTRLPEAFSNLPSLEYLYINDCPSLEGLPDSFGKLPSLKKLEIKKCPSLKHLPESFGYLPSLEEFLIEDTPIEDFPASSEHLTSLKRIEIRKHPLEYLPARIGELKAVEIIKIEECPKIKDVPSSWTRLTSLEVLKMNKCGLTEFPKKACDIRCLEVLDLDYNEIESIPDDILKLKNLYSFSMSYNTIKKLNPNLADLPSIMELDLSDNFIKKVPKEFLKLLQTPFKSLNLWENPVDYVPSRLRTSKIVKI